MSTARQADWGEIRAAARRDGIVVVGAGQAGGRAVEALRGQGFAGRITLLGDEAEPPYERPSLSKEMLLKPEAETIAWVQKPEFYVGQDIALRPGVRATKIDRQARVVALENGEALRFGALILATGARVRKLDLPGAGDETCHYIRTLDDSRALRARLTENSRVVVIGAGFIGLEAAAAAVQRGCSVTVVELGPQPLGRVVPEPIGAYYQQLHAAHGVTFLFNTQLRQLKCEGAQVVVETAAGAALTADTVVVGIGVLPNAELAAAAGLTVDRGIVVDEFGMTDDAHVFAAGDVSRHYNPLLNRHVLLESWQNAQNQAIAIARNLAGEAAPAPYAELPWFWSDQYDINLQMFGLSEADAVTVRRGAPEAKSQMLFQVKKDRIICAIGMNAARDLRAARELMTLGAVVQSAELADAGVPLIELVRRWKRQNAPASAG
jgi:NADPH-dependent 2,4-dienoyl-CoA reductase/sulfur reductase-like enzyme